MMTECVQPEMHSDNGGSLRHCPCGWSQAPRTTFRGYEFAGTTIGGENLMACLTCGALVKSSSEPLHRSFHERGRP